MNIHQCICTCTCMCILTCMCTHACAHDVHAPCTCARGCSRRTLCMRVRKQIAQNFVHACLCCGLCMAQKKWRAHRMQRARHAILHSLADEVRVLCDSQLRADCFAQFLQVPIMQPSQYDGRNACHIPWCREGEAAGSLTTLEPMRPWPRPCLDRRPLWPRPLTGSRPKQAPAVLNRRESSWEPS